MSVIQRYHLAVSYVGTRFAGWAAQPTQSNVETVCSAVDAAISKVVGLENHEGAIVSSRTDTGVHAIFNTFHVDVHRKPRLGRTLPLLPLESRQLMHGINAHLSTAGTFHEHSL
jgi:tRNA pseudouridine38-40 synthase